MKTTNDNPNEKSSRSQSRRILAYLRAGNKITPGECRKLFGSDRLSARIKDIEEMVGYPPERQYVKVLSFDADGNPTTKRVMQYWLKDEN